MPSTYSPILRIEEQAIGENNNSWGTLLNTALRMLENAIAKRQTLTVTSADVTLTTNNGSDDQARSLCLAASGTLTGNRNIIVPALSKLYVVTNGCTGSFSLTVKTSAGSGIVVTQGSTVLLYCNGTNVVAFTDSSNFTTIDLGGTTDTTLTRSSAGVLAVEGNAVITTVSGDARYMQQGLVTIPIMAAAMVPNDSAPPEMVYNRINNTAFRTLDFDKTTQEAAGFVIPFPKSFNNGTLTFQPIWIYTDPAVLLGQTVYWWLGAYALSNSGAIDGGYGSYAESADAAIAAEDVHIGPTSGALTIANTPADDDLVFFQILRRVSDDTLAGDAKLIGLRLYFTQNASDDT